MGTSCFLSRQNIKRDRRGSTILMLITRVDTGSIRLSQTAFCLLQIGDDPKNRVAGLNTSHETRMRWLEKYCRERPLDLFVKAAMELHDALGK